MGQLYCIYEGNSAARCLLIGSSVLNHLVSCFACFVVSQAAMLLHRQRRNRPAAFECAP
jgi:hypothetical protein